MLDKFKIGHYSDTENGTGVTVILAEDGAVGGVSVRGSSPATRETDLLKSEKTVEQVNAVVLSGGSAYGLEASCGVMEYLTENKKGYNAGKYNVPIVVGASLYDLEYKNFAYPDKKAGYEACKNAKVANFEKGEIGVATGATIAKMLGMDSAVKTTLGIQTYVFNNLEVAVIVGVNAIGDIVKNGEILAGLKGPDGSYLDSKRLLSAGGTSLKNSNTTIACVITNARLTKVEANIIADIAHDGYVRALSPAHTRFDGDAIFVMASGEVDCGINMLTAIVPDLVEKAVQSSVGNTEPIKAHVNPFVFKLFKKFIG